MPDEISVSVIVPVYNTAAYLKRSMDALVNQSLEKLEILVIDDGSTDESPQILRDYEEKYPSKVRVIHQENRGQAAARNLGIREARGTYIGFADSDDYVHREMYRKMYELATETGADYVECRYHAMLEGESGIREISPRGRIRAHKETREMLIDPQVSPWNKLFQREVLLKSGAVFPEGFIYEDTSWYAKCVPYIRKTAFLDEAPVYYSIRENSTMTGDRGRRVADIFPVLKDMLFFYRERGFFDAYQNELEYFCVKIALCSNLARIGRVGDGKLAGELTRRTFAFVEEEFPEYRGNPYFTGKTGLYIRNVRRWNGRICSKILGRIMKG
uniref:glycosyltransferase family 2 protein n=1 Tax=Eubacterium cellulosolvens TaxID=29322 RepID=UPI0004810CF3|nr:glycosyltransferase family 2 protein [[Eubacterium] cellulosolvens]